VKYTPFGKIRVNLDFRISYDGILAAVRSVREGFVRLWNRISGSLAKAYRSGLQIMARHAMNGREIQTTYTPSVSVVEAQTVMVQLSAEEVSLVSRHLSAHGGLEVITINDAGVSAS